MPQALAAAATSQTTVERSHVNELIAWVLKGEIDFRLGSEQRVRSQGDAVVIPGGTEHEARFRDTEVIDFFAPPRDDFLLGGKPAYMSKAEQLARTFNLLHGKRRDASVGHL
jgi:glyoxylate utilization-related uncharacterized protein